MRPQDLALVYSVDVKQWESMKILEEALPEDASGVHIREFPAIIELSHLLIIALRC